MLLLPSCSQGRTPLCSPCFIENQALLSFSHSFSQLLSGLLPLPHPSPPTRSLPHTALFTVRPTSSNSHPTSLLPFTRDSPRRQSIHTSSDSSFPGLCRTYFRFLPPPLHKTACQEYQLLLLLNPIFKVNFQFLSYLTYLYHCGSWSLPIAKHFHLASETHIPWVFLLPQWHPHPQSLKFKYYGKFQMYRKAEIIYRIPMYPSPSFNHYPLSIHFMFLFSVLCQLLRIFPNLLLKFSSAPCL